MVAAQRQSWPGTLSPVIDASCATHNPSIPQTKQQQQQPDAFVYAIALTAVTTIVNTMKNHLNKPAVQEKACVAFSGLTSADGYREVSFAASGAEASIVAAM